MSRLLHPNGEINIPTALIIARGPEQTASSVAVATRSDGACCTAANGSVTRYATLASRYRPMTIEVPSASDSGTFRRGSRTSPAVKVMLFHASAEKSDPVCETQIATNNPNVVAAETPGVMSENPRRVQNLPKLSATASWFQPRIMPTATSPTTAPVFVVVKTFCTIRPYSRPRVFVHVSRAMSRTPTSCAVESESAYPA